MNPEPEVNVPATLAIETSHSRGSIAVVRDGALAFQQSFTSERSHNSQLFAPLAEALSICGTDLHRIVVGLGPGSYTGARIGIAAAQGIALSRNVPIIGLPSVLAPDWSPLPDAFTVCGDARRGTFFIARISHRSLVEPISLHDSAEFTQLRASDPHTTWFTFDPKPPASVSDLLLTTPSASRLAHIASTLTPPSDLPVLEPLYLAAPFITVPK